MGQKYASYNTSGAVIAYYDSVDSPPPANATIIPITDQEWLGAINSQYQPITVVNGTLIIPSGPTLAQAQSAQIAILKAGYLTAINAPVSFTNAAGVASTYPSGNTVLITGDKAKTLLSEIISAGSAAWTLGKWVDMNDVAQTFTFADLQGLASAMEAAVAADYGTLVNKIAAVNAATTVSAVQAVTW